MGDSERPVEGRPDQDEQAALIRRTGNGPTVPNEVELLEAEYGPADMAGVYQGRGEQPAVGETREPAVDEAPAEGEKAEASA
jgi:hypothetical protein